MVKTPTNSEKVPPEFVEQRTQFLHDFAATIALWGNFEFALEVKIAALSGLKPMDASIILGSLGFGTKSNILYSLLAQRADASSAAAVRAVVNHVGRNAMIHGIAGSEPEDGRFIFFRREVGDAYVVKHIHYTSESFNEHFETFRRLENEAMLALNLSDDDLKQYAREAGLFEPTPQRPQVRRQRAVRDNKSARKRRRREAQEG